MRALAASVLCALGLGAGCGGEAGDLMAIEVSGGFAKSRGPLRIVLESDGRGHCGDRPTESVPSDLVIDARELERDLDDLAEEGAQLGTARPGGASYVVRIKAGTVRWSEGTDTLPDALSRAQLMALRLDRLLCR